MPADFIVINFSLMIVGFLFEADAHIGPISVELAERQFKQPLQYVENDERQNEQFCLLEGMGCLMTLVPLRKPVGAILADKDAWPYCQCPESLHWEMSRVYLL